MPKEKSKGITVKKEENMPEWYEQVILKGELAEHAPIKGCMVIRPLGYSIWQKIMDYFNERIKTYGVKNAYFPMFIPEDFFYKESEHAKGFKPEVAWVEPKNEDKAKYAIRPTSETIIYDAFQNWVRSWRDLPLKINQWCNICRWEVQDCKLFLRSREFLWQEGHCAYVTEKECDREAQKYLEEYKKLAENLLAIPVIKGKKTEKERFAGAKTTYTIETLMPDGKGLQLGTSHNLGQGFGKAFEIEYVGKDTQKHHPWQNSWGISTRMIGATVMMHSDNKGLIIPPKVAETQVVIIPIIFDKTKNKVLKEAEKITKELNEYSIFIDDRDGYSPGWKFNEWEIKGVPIRIEIGPKDIEKKQCVLVRRDTSQKRFIKIKDIKKEVEKTLEDIQDNLFKKAKKFLKQNTIETHSWKDFQKAIKNKKLVKTSFCGDIECEDFIKEKTGGATSRCIPLRNNKPKKSKCVHCNKKSTVEIYFAKNY